MCGISGVLAQNISESDENLIREIINFQQPRGPDYQAMTRLSSASAQVLLGHNRLSIIDLSPEANQPLSDVAGRYCVSYNGEIYNYLELREELKREGFAFRTQCDTEIVLNGFACWGWESLARFNGPFAFSLFDRQTGDLWLARDRFGVRPLYYIMKNGKLYFSSSSSVLAKALGLSPDFHYIARGLHSLTFENEDSVTPWDGLSTLPGGHCLRARVTRGDLSLTLHPWYSLAERVDVIAESLPAGRVSVLTDRIAEVMHEAVRIRLRSDVPLGITLSSGLDSSSVAALVREQHDNAIGFSFGHPMDNKTEGPLVAKCARHLGLKMVYVSPSPEEMIDALFRTLEVQEAPFSSLSVVAQYLLYKQIHASGIKVILGGQGGDESFMGYRKFILFWMQSLLSQKKYPALIKNMIQFLPMVMAELPSFSVYWKNRHRYLGKNENDTALQLPGLSSLSLGHSPRSDLRRRQIEDITRFSLPTLLRYEDRNAMGNSVESRLPFLDYRLVELGVALPVSLKLHRGHGKWPVRHIMQGKIPETIRLARYKRGFDIQMHALLKAGLGRSIRAVLEDNYQIQRSFLKPRVRVADAFSDQALLHRRSAIPEAIALLWLDRMGI